MDGRRELAEGRRDLPQWLAKEQGKYERLRCKILDLKAPSDEIPACHSSLGGAFGEGIDVARMPNTGCAGASEARVLDEPTSPIRPAVE